MRLVLLTFGFGAVSAIIPIVVIFFLFQNFFVKGITVSGLKG